MNYDEFAFFNQQLASMLRDGIPLESALKRLCAEMKRGRMRVEFESLEIDLAKGVPLADAIKRRRLPEFYIRMVQIAAKSNDAPGILTMLADYYQRRNLLATKLKGLMVYPLIVLVSAFLLSIALHHVMIRVVEIMRISPPPSLITLGESSSVAQGWSIASAGLWFIPFAAGLAGFLVVLLATMPKFRRWARWKLPAFQEASLSQLALALALMLRSGVPLPDAILLLQELERETPVSGELEQWRDRLAKGAVQFTEIAGNSRLIPPLFVWTVAHARENLTDGLAKVSEVFRARANYRSDVLLQAFLPCAVLALGILIALQMIPFVVGLLVIFGYMSDAGGVE